MFVSAYNRSKINMNNNSLLVHKVYKRFYISTVITFLLKTSVSFIGVFFAGNMLGPAALGTAGLLMPFLFLYIALGALYDIGGVTLCSRYIGESDFDGAKKVVTAAYVSNFILCFVIAILGFLFIDNIMSVLRVPAEMLDEAKVYAGVCLVCGFFCSAVSIGTGFLRFEGMAVAITVATALSPLCTLGLTYVLIRYAGFGLSAVAVGINSGYVLTGSVMMYMVAVKTKVLGFARIKAAELMRMFTGTVKNGLSATAANICDIPRTMIINSLIITAYGQLAMSAYSAFLSLVQLTLVVSLGSSLAFVQLAGVMNAERDSASLKQLIKMSLGYGLSVAVIIGAGMIAFSGPIASGFGMDSAETGAMMHRLLMVLAICNVCEVLHNTIVFLYNTLGRHTAATVLVLCRSIVLPVILLYTLSGILGLTGVWYSLWLCIPLTIGAALAYSFVISGKNRYLTRIFLIDTEAEQNGTYVSLSIENTFDDIMDCSRKISSFCEQNRLDKSQSYLIALAIEEMLLLIREYNLKNRRGTMNVRILLHQNDIVLRVRSGGDIFNPLAFYRDLKLSGKLTLDGALEHKEFLGLKMVMDAAKNVDYRRTFGVNNLAVTI